MRTAGITALAMLAGYCAGHAMSASEDAFLIWATGVLLIVVGAFAGGAVQEDGR